MTKYQGKIIQWQDDKGFGFIQLSNSTTHPQRVFFHINDYRAKNRPVIDEGVVFEIGQGRDGKPCAINVQQQSFVNQQVARKNAYQARQARNDIKNNTLMMWTGFGVGFLLLLVVTVVALKLPMWLIWWYLAINLATFLLYAHDKKAAQNGDWRVQEATLHKLAFAGGWIGATFAHWLLRHKSSKAEFRKNFYLTVIGNIIGLAIIGFIRFRHISM